MAIFLLFSLLFIAYALKDFKNAFVLFCAIKIFALPAMCIKYSSPSISINTLLDFFFIVLFFKKYSWKSISYSFKNYPIKKYLILALISIIASAIVSITPLSATITGLIYYVMDDIIIPILFYLLYLEDKKIIRRFITSSMAVFTFASIYGIVEYVTQTNFLFDYIIENVDKDFLAGKFFLGGERGGMIRINSLFTSPNLFIYGALISSLSVAYNQKYNDTIKFTIPFTFLALFMILIANSRTVLIASLVAVFPIFLFSKKKIEFIGITGIILIVALPFLLQYIDNITSVFSVSGKNDIEGSSISMRLEQLDASYLLFLNHPFLGNGYQSLKYFIDPFGGNMADVLRGAESIWFQLMIERGIVGILVYLYLFYCMFFRLGAIRNVFFLFFCLGYLVGNTMSSLPGFSFGWLYIAIVSYSSIIKEKNESRSYYHTQNI